VKATPLNQEIPDQVFADLTKNANLATETVSINGVDTLLSVN